MKSESREMDSSASESDLRDADGNPIKYHPGLFCHNLRSCTFVIYPSTAMVMKDKEYHSWTSIIQANDGGVLKITDNNSIPLLDEILMERYKIRVSDIKCDVDLFSSQFINDSIKNGFLVDLNEYRCSNETRISIPSKYEPYDANEILLNVRGWSDLMPRKTHNQGKPLNFKRAGRSAEDKGKKEQERNNSRDNEFDGNNNNDKGMSPVEVEAQEDGEDDETSSLIIDPPAVDVEKLKEVPLDDMGLPLLPKRSSIANTSLFKRSCVLDSTSTRTANSTKVVGKMETYQPLTQPRLLVAKPAKIFRLAECATEKTHETRSDEPVATRTRFRSGSPAWPASTSTVSSVGDMSDPEPSPTPTPRKQLLPRAVSPIDDIPEADFNRTSPSPLSPRVLRLTHSNQPAAQVQPQEVSRPNTLTSRAFLPIGTPYTRQEDEKLLKTVIENKWYAHYAGNSIYEWMEQNRELNFRRTHQSLQNRFKKYVLPNLHKFKLTEGQRLAFRNGRREVRKNKRLKAILPPLP